MGRIPDIDYGRWLNDLTVDGIRDRLADLGCDRAIVKRLSQNHNSKNQIYVGKDLTELNGLPIGPLSASESTSSKHGGPTKPKFQAPVALSWLVPDSSVTVPAPSTKVIYYPQYPEVRLSGFLKGCPESPAFLMSPDARGKDEGRILILGLAAEEGDTCPSNSVFAIVLPPEARAAEAVWELATPAEGGFRLWSIGQAEPASADPRRSLISRASEIRGRGWLPLTRMLPDGSVISYNAQNAHGYTIEAAFGVRPNGRAEPDFEGWELKSHVSASGSGAGSPLTLLTPEPDGGMYLTDGQTGLLSFMLAVGHRVPEQKSSASQPFGTKWYFTGAHQVGIVNAKPTPTLLQLSGFTDAQTFDAQGHVELLGPGQNVLASWSFSKLLDHWKTKHASTCYLPVELDRANNRLRLKDEIWVAEGTRFGLFLDGLCRGDVFYDPGTSATLMGSTGQWRFKRRNQFRAKPGNLASLYDTFTRVPLG